MRTAGPSTCYRAQLGRIQPQIRLWEAHGKHAARGATSLRSRSLEPAYLPAFRPPIVLVSALLAELGAYCGSAPFETEGQPAHARRCESSTVCILPGPYPSGLF